MFHVFVQPGVLQLYYPFLSTDGSLTVTVKASLSRTAELQTPSKSLLNVSFMCTVKQSSRTRPTVIQEE